MVHKIQKLKKRIIISGFIISLFISLNFSLLYYLNLNKSIWEIPGIDNDFYENIIRIGLLGDTHGINGIGNYEGAWLAAYEINTAGGIDIDDKKYYIGLLKEDTHEENLQLDLNDGLRAAKKIIDIGGVEYIIGGYRSTVLEHYLDYIMAQNKIFMNTGVTSDYFCENVLNFYDQYKYFFRIMPLNSSSLGKELSQYLIYLSKHLNETVEQNIHNVSIVRENTEWTENISSKLFESLQNNAIYNLSIVQEIINPINATWIDYYRSWNQIKSIEPQIIVPIITSKESSYLMKRYILEKPGFVFVGIDIESQLDSFWVDTNEGCEFETIMIPNIRNNKTNISEIFWVKYVSTFEHEPIYSAVGAYDAVNLLSYVINKTQSLNNSIIIKELEKINKTNPLWGRSITFPLIAFNKYHDLIEGWPYGTFLFTQWQNGTKVCVPSGNAFNYIYPNNITTGNYILPSREWSNWTFNP